MKPASPLLGFNNNVRHKGRVFHIQTEDSGVRHPHIITHLFADGGRILKTTKTSYAEFIDAANMGDVVRQMMQDQHKAMFMALRDGQFDHLVEEVASRGSQGGQRSTGALPAVLPPSSVRVPVEPPPPAPTPVSPLGSTIAKAPTLPSVPVALHRPAAIVPPPPTASAPAAVAVPPLPPIAPIAVPAAPVAAPAASAAATAITKPAIRIPASPPPPAPAAPIAAAPLITRPTPPRVASARPRLDIDPAAIHRAPALNTETSGGTLASIVEATVQAGPTIDIDTLERAAAASEAPLFQEIHDLPPPPAAVIGARAATGSAGAYSSVAAPGPTAPAPPSARGRYAPSRPSSIFAAVRPQEGASIFGEDLISEKSLDEVILSYLAEDLEGPGEKK